MSEYLSYELFKIGTYTFTVGTILTVVLFLIGTRLFIVFLTRVFTSMANRRQIDRGRQNSLLLLIRYFIWVVAVFVILHVIGIEMTFLIASSAALLVGIGLGLQQIFADFMSGIFMLYDGTIKQGDILEVDDMVGVIEKINLRTTILRNRDDVIVIIPNHKFTEDMVINWSHNTGVTRFKVSVGVSYLSDMDKVREILLSCAAKNAHVVSNNNNYRTTVRMAEFGTSSLVFELLFYSSNMFRIESTKSEIRFSIWHAFREHGIKIPFPQLDLHVKEQGPIAKE